MTTDELTGGWRGTVRRRWAEADKERLLKLCFYTGILSVVLFMLFAARGYSWEDRLFAYVVGVLTVLILLVQLLFLLAPGLQDWVVPTQEQSSLQEKFSQGIEGRTDSGRSPEERRHAEVQLVVWITALPIAVFYLGMLLVLPTWVFGFVWYFYGDLKTALASTVVFTVGSYVIFVLFLDLIIWPGALFT